MLKYFNLKKLIATTLLSTFLFLMANSVFAQANWPGIEGAILEALKAIDSKTADIKGHTSSINDAVSANIPNATNYLLAIRNNLSAYLNTQQIGDQKTLYGYVSDIFNQMNAMYIAMMTVPKDLGPMRWRYRTAKSIDEASKEDYKNLSEEINNLLQYGRVFQGSSKGYVPPTQDLLQQETLKVSPMSIKSFYAEDIYGDDDQTKAAKYFLKNASGVYIGIPSVETAGNIASNETARKYAAYRTTLTSIQSAAASTLIESYVSRVRRNDNTSKLKLLKEMNIEDPSNDSYWSESGLGSKNIFVRAFAFFDAFFAMNRNLYQIYGQLERINIQLAMMTTQNTILLESLVGKPLRDELSAKAGESVRVVR